MRYSLFPVVALALIGCNSLENDAQRGFYQTGTWTTPASYTTADVRMVTERHVGTRTIICTEPSPDVAKALSTALDLSAKYENFQGGVSSASAEAAMELAGRSTALLGLRDGLFRACEAYSNGIIGDAAYTLVLTRYGQLMTTLFLGQDVSALPALPNNPSISGPSIPPPPGAAPGPPAPRAASDVSGTTERVAQERLATDVKTAAVAAATQDRRSNPDPPPANSEPRQVAWNNAGEIFAQSPGLSALTGAYPGSGSAASTGATTTIRDQSQQDLTQAATGLSADPTAAAHRAPPAGAAKPKAAASKQGTTAAGGQDNSASSALRGMNYDYLGLDRDPLQLIHSVLVACINELDPTRFGNNLPNTFLRSQFCNNPTRIDQMLQLLFNSLPAATARRSP
jgi:hypothetical protein